MTPVSEGCLLVKEKMPILTGKYNTVAQPKNINREIERISF